jgi:DNA-binding LytR/AlgR family response regulator
MKNISCIAIDDEPMALLVIEQFCQRRGGIELTTYSEPQNGIDEIIRTKPQLVFLDIHMSSINGLDIARSIPHETCIIFTTAHAQYALEGFNLDAVDYLHKPFAYERFCRAVDKAMRRMNPTSVNPQRHITVKQEYSNVNILLNDILYIEALGNYVKIVKATGGNVLTRTNMKTLMHMLPQEAFVRIHRSYIVPLNKINSFTRHNVFINGTDSPLPIGHQYANELSERIQHHSHLI